MKGGYPHGVDAYGRRVPLRGCRPVGLDPHRDMDCGMRARRGRLSLALRAVIWGTLVGGSLPSQGQIMKERWSYAELQSLRRTLLDECDGRDPEMLAAVARDLIGSRQGQSFRPALRALARLRGVESDLAFLYRGSLRAVAGSPSLPWADRPSGP